VAALVLGLVGRAVAAQGSGAAEVAGTAQAGGALQEEGQQPLEALRAALEAEREAARVREPLPAELEAAFRAAEEGLTRLAGHQAGAAAFAEQAAAARARSESLRTALALPPEEGEPPAPEGADLRALEELVRSAEADLAAARARSAAIATESAEVQARSDQIPAELARAQEALGAAEQTLAGLVPAEPGDTAAALRALALRIEVESARAQAAALVAERDLCAARFELLPLRRDDAQRAAVRAEQLVRLWQTRVSQQRQLDAAGAARDAERRRLEATGSHAELADIAAANQALAALREGENGLPARIERAAAELLALERDLGELVAREASTRRKVAVAGVNEGIGNLMRRDAQWLPGADELAVSVRARAAELSTAQLDLIDFEEQRERLGDTAARHARLMASVRADLGTERAAQLEAIALELVRAQRTQLDTLVAEQSALLRALADQVELERARARVAESYRRFIDERVLWFPSASAADLVDLEASAQALGWLFSAPTWADLAGALASVAGGPRVLAALALLLAWVVLRGRMRRAIEATGARARSFRSDGHRLTVRAVALLAAATLPPWLAGLLVLEALVRVPDLSTSTLALVRAAGSALWVAAALHALYTTCAPRGVGETLFRQPAARLAALRGLIRGFAPPYVLLLLLALALDAREVAALGNSLGRVAFVAAQVVLLVGLRRAVDALGLWHPEGTDGASAGRARVRRTWIALVLLGPLVWIALALLGYGYAAFELELYYRRSLFLGLCVALLHALLLRWLFVARRRLAIGRAQARVQARSDATDDGATSAASVDDDIDLPVVDAQTRQFFRSLLVVATVLGLYSIWSAGLPAVEMLDRVELWPRPLHVVAENEPEPGFATVAAAAAPAPGPAGSTPNGGVASLAPGAGELLVGLDGSAPAAPAATGLADARVTVADLVLMLMIVLLTIVAAKNVPGLLEITLLKQLPLDGGARNALATLTRYLIVIVGSSASFGALGIGWDKVQWLAAALTFGLAFGLQEVFANFVSGLIILIERPIRVGDIVTVGGVEGRVTRLRMRATTIVDWDRKELLVPNKEFITSSIVNWTLSDPITRVTVRVAAAHGSDTRLVESTLLAVAAAEPLVLADPEPHVMLRGLGPDGLAFELRAFIDIREDWNGVVHRLHMGIEAALREHGVAVAFPQREVHVRSLRGLSAEALPPSARP
jgi:potassium efflux system protein